MKNLPLLLTALIMTATLPLHAESPTPSPALVEFFKNLKSGQKQTVVAFGTSLTKYGVWVQLMQDWFNQKYPGLVTVINNGGPGRNSDWGVEQYATQVVAQHPNLVFVEFSYNDAHERFKLTPEHCKENLDKIAQGILKEDPKAAIVLQTMNAPWDAPEGAKTSETDRPHIEAYNDNYRTYGKEHNLPVVDNYPEWVKIKTADPERYHAMVPDGSHPNKNGSLAVTWPGVEALLEAAARQ